MWKRETQVFSLSQEVMRGNAPSFHPHSVSNFDQVYRGLGAERHILTRPPVLWQKLEQGLPAPGLCVYMRTQQ